MALLYLFKPQSNFPIALLRFLALMADVNGLWLKRRALAQESAFLFGMWITKQYFQGVYGPQNCYIFALVGLMPA